MLILSIVTVLFAIFTALVVLFKKTHRLSDIVFSVSLLATACVISGDTIIVLRPELLGIWKKIVFISETIMASSWLLFTLSFARTDYRKAIGKFSKFLLFLSPALIIFLLIVPQKAFFYSPEFETEGVLFLGNAGYIFNLMILLYSVVSIINLEATLKSSSGTSRWQIKYALVGVGAIFAVNIFYYSHALLYRSINMNLLPVKTGVFLISFILISFALLRHKFMDVEVSVSRKIFYRSLTLIIVGLYLLGLGLIGEGMRYFGPKVGRNIATFLGFAGAIGIIVLILSEQLRKKVMVFINKNFYSQKYDYRSQWLQFTHLISSKHSFDDLLISIARGFKKAMGVRGASVWLQEKDNGGYYCAKTVDAVAGNVKPGKDLTDFLQASGWVFNANDEKCETVTLQNIEFIESSKASLIVPLQDKNNLIGFIVLRESLIDNDCNYEDYDLLKALARQATSAIMNARLTEELAESREMEAVGRVSSFIMHDLKNAASMLTFVTQNAKEHINNPDFQKDAMKSVANTAEKIKGLMQKLKNLPGKIYLNFEFGDLGLVVKDMVKEFNLNDKIVLRYEELESVRTMFDREEIKKVILNLLINAIDAIKEEGRIEVKIGVQDNLGYIKVSDNGVGMSKEFIETTLFKPFKTTKINGLGIGLYQSRIIVDAHAGRLKVKSAEGEGTVFTVYLPIKAA